MSEYGCSSKKILVASHDRGGANALMALLQQQPWFAQQHLSFYFAGPALLAYGDSIKQHPCFQHIAELPVQHFDAVLCGSSHLHNLERDVLLWAAAQHIPSCCVIDSWMNLTQRFWHPELQCYALPSLISVIDQASYGKFLTELPECPANIIIGGQPYLAGLLAQSESSSYLQADKNVTSIAPVTLSTSTRLLRMLFCSEPMRLGYNQDGALGFDEFSVFSDLVALFEQQQLPVQILLRLHPSEQLAAWEAFLAGLPALRYVQLLPMHVNTSLADPQLDLVVGLASMALLEAVLAGQRTISCQFAGRFIVAPEIVQWTEQCHSIAEFWQVLQQPATGSPSFAQLSQVLAQSSQRISYYFQRLCKPALQLRRAAAQDASCFFAWANDPMVRQNAFQSAPIPWPQHLHWFTQKLQSQDALLQIAMYQQQFIGQVRLERKDLHQAVLDYSLAAEVRGQGFASALLQQACHFAFTQGFCKRILAQVKLENFASQKALLTAGFYPAGAATDLVNFELNIDAVDQLKCFRSGHSNGMPTPA